MRIDATTQPMPIGSPSAPSLPPRGMAVDTVAVPQRADTLQTKAPTGSVPATLPLDGAPGTPPDGGVDFTKIFQGFAVGGKVKIGCSIPLAGGQGTITALEPGRFAISGKVSVVGLVNEKLDFDLKRQDDGTYRADGNLPLHASVTQNGNRLTITDLDSPTHHVYLTATKAGTIEVKTEGLGFDKVSGKVRAK